MITTTNDNTSYIFMPFVYGSSQDFHKIMEALDNSRNWNRIEDKNIYMLKYIADKIDCRDREKCLCFHYRHRDGAVIGNCGSEANDGWCLTEEHSYNGETVRFRFQILSVELFCFATSVGIVAFRLHFDRNDPLWISNALYYLKKVSREKIAQEIVPDIRADGDNSEKMTFLELAKSFTSELNDLLTPGLTEESELRFFYHANPLTERANVLTFLQVKEEPDCRYEKELFYLRNCYSEGFLYDENEKPGENEINRQSKDIIWGISSEAAVCLACPDYGRADFINHTFYENFNEQYLFMYVLLLHQKYVLYMFLTKIGIGAYNSLETLEKYRDELYEFETDFVFTCVTEVPQYQKLYDKMMNEFSLKQMYEDVHEPLISLGEIRRKHSEEEQKKREERTNNALGLLSVFCVFSALVDSFDFINSFCAWFLPAFGIKVVQVIFIIGIVGLWVYLCRQISFFKKK